MGSKRKESKTSAENSPKCRAKGKRRYSVRGDKRRDTLEYWETRLARCGLSMEAGHDGHWLVYQGILGRPDEYGNARDDIYVPPTGERLDLGEWPISLC